MDTTDILSEIFLFLHGSDYRFIPLVNRLWYKVYNDVDMWRRKTTHRYPLACQHKPSNITYRQQFYELCERQHTRPDLLMDMYNPSQQDLVNIAAYDGRLDIIQAYGAKGVYPNQIGIGFATYAGHLYILEWLYDKEQLPNNSPAFQLRSIFEMSPTLVAATQNHTHILKWLVSKGFTLDSRVANAAIKNGNIETLSWLEECGIQPYNSGTDVVKNGYIHMVKWMTRRYDHNNDNIGCYDIGWGKTAADISNIELLDFLYQRDISFCAIKDDPYRLITKFAPNDVSDVKVMEWFLSRGIEPQSIYYMMNDTHLEVIQYLSQKNILHKYLKGFENYHIERAARYGHTHMLRLLYSLGYQMGSHAMKSAACGSHIGTMVWLRSVGVDVTSEHANIAGFTGNIEVLEWCEQQGVYPGIMAANYAAARGHIRMLDRLAAKGMWPNKLDPNSNIAAVGHWIRNHNLNVTVERLIYPS